LSPPPPSPLAPIESREETSGYQLTQVLLENGCENGDKTANEIVANEQYFNLLI